MTRGQRAARRFRRLILVAGSLFALAGLAWMLLPFYSEILDGEFVGLIGTPLAPLDNYSAGLYAVNVLLVVGLLLFAAWAFLRPGRAWTAKLTETGRPLKSAVLAAAAMAILLSTGVVTLILELPDWWEPIMDNDNKLVVVPSIWAGMLLLWAVWAHAHWHVDVSYINICGTFCYLCSLLDSCSRYVVHWEIRQFGTNGSFTYVVDPDGDGLTDADWVDRPVNYVSWGDAARFCNWMHNGQPSRPQDSSTTEGGSYLLEGATSDGELLSITRSEAATFVIPSEDEWYKAAYYDGTADVYYDYPTRTNAPPAAEAPPGTDMTNGSVNYGDNDVYVIGSPYYRTQVGAYDARPSDSPYGTYDQAGNVWEWNEAVVLGAYRCFRGGSFGDDDDYPLHANHRSYVAPTDEGFAIGFRIARIPPCCPAATSFGIVTMAGILMGAGILVVNRKTRLCMR